MAKIRLNENRFRRAVSIAMKDVTVLIKAYNRPMVLRKQLLALRKFYPSLPAVVVDDGAARCRSHKRF